MNQEYTFTFDKTLSCVRIQEDFPSADRIRTDYEASGRGPVGQVLLVCDTNTEYIARDILGTQTLPCCVLPSGETAKQWVSVEAILRAATEAGLGRDGLFIGIGGGVVNDLTAFAASIYMRGAGLCLVSTSLLGMVDAAVGGKSGFDLFGMKNLAGTFYPAPLIYMPLHSLLTLPKAEWKSGMGELIKTAVLDTSPALLGQLRSRGGLPLIEPRDIQDCIIRAVLIKGRIVEADPKETGEERAHLNLGHTFAHALESAAGLGQVSHGEAVAWGMVRACELGYALGITPGARAEAITGLIKDWAYETRAPHPLLRAPGSIEAFMRALGGDKKKKAGNLMFMVPAAQGVQRVSAKAIEAGLVERIICGTRDTSCSATEPPR
ncbi:MAG: 3-dehydroquinate synthase [Treponema sp.]|jgi:3-dehydroquinate synthase|nr:3-dehydroquinate synthase [Treponema sp.]